MPETTGFPVSPTRRGVVAAAGGVGLAAVLTACGSDSSSDSASDTSSPASDDSPSAGAATPSTDSGSGSSSTSAAAGGGGTPLAKTSEIPVGGGKIFPDQKVVVTQPTSGQFKGFSAICTHMGCTVTSVSDGTINCPCHGSKYHVADGTVANGPATQGLPPKQVSVSGDEVTMA